MSDVTTALSQRDVRSIATVHELDVDDVIQQVQKIQRVMEAVMRSGEHYGVIPGTDKPTLLKPGAEKLCLVFRLDPQYEVTQTLSEGAHLTIVSRCTLYHIPTSNRMGSGMGSCSTRESKYRYRQAKRVCPACGKDAIIRGKPEWGGGWVCYKKKDGCGSKFADNDALITGQPLGRVENPDLADQYNTILKMAAKRSLVAAVLNVTAASDIFTQDLEDMPPPSSPPERKDKDVPIIPTTPPIPVEGEGTSIDLDDNGEPAAPIEEWIAAIEQAQSAKALHAVWKGCTAPELWPTWSPEEQARLISTKDTAKQRLGIG
jgi:hypothetical protein